MHSVQQPCVSNCIVYSTPSYRRRIGRISIVTPPHHEREIQSKLKNPSTKDEIFPGSITCTLKTCDDAYLSDARAKVIQVRQRTQDIFDPFSGKCRTSFDMVTTPPCRTPFSEALIYKIDDLLRGACDMGNFSYRSILDERESSSTAVSSSVCGIYHHHGGRISQRKDLSEIPSEIVCIHRKVKHRHVDAVSGTKKKIKPCKWEKTDVDFQLARKIVSEVYLLSLLDQR